MESLVTVTRHWFSSNTYWFQLDLDKFEAICEHQAILAYSTIYLTAVFYFEILLVHRSNFLFPGI